MLTSVVPLISWYRLLKWLNVYISYCDPFSGMPQKRELSTSVILDDNPVQGCSKELEPLQMRLQRYVMMNQHDGVFFMKTSGASKKWKFGRSTAEVLYLVFVLMSDDVFIVEGPHQEECAIVLNSTDS